MTTIDYSKIIKEYPWLLKQGSNYILSPDSDGFLCGLLLTNILKGQVCGFYDGKILLISNDIDPKDAIFIDVDINRKNIRSIGHHMVVYNKGLGPLKTLHYESCIQPNNMMGYDGKNDFQSKYPFATIHLLLSIFHEANIIKSIPEKSVWPLLFTDGVWNNLFGYTENCLSWFKLLGIDKKKHILNQLFCSNDMSFYKIMVGLNELLRIRDKYNAKGAYDGTIYRLGGRNKRTGDKLRITNSSGQPINLESINKHYKIHDDEKNRVVGFIKEMAVFMRLVYDERVWSWDRLKIYQFTKGILSAMSNRKYLSLMRKNPLSMAITSGQEMEYTLEAPDKIS